MKSTDHLQMPELISSEYTVQLSDEERRRYDELKSDLVLQIPDGEITAANAAALTGKLCQMANGAVYSDSGEVVYIHEQKLDALEDIIESANGKPLIVAYWFKHDLARITERLQKLKVLFSKLDTPESIKRWNDGELTVALIHPASAGHGLNLQFGGSNLVWFGLTWSFELYQQTIARLWRQGQGNNTVVVQHIVAKGTIDERIQKALKHKDSTQSALIDAVKMTINDNQLKSLHSLKWYNVTSGNTPTHTCSYGETREGFLFTQKGSKNMPHKPQRPCAAPRCTERAIAGEQYCAAHQRANTREYNRYRRDPNCNKRYDKTWRRIRCEYIKAHPLCEECRELGVLTPATEVHHVLPLSDGGTHDKKNLMSLCHACHSRFTLKHNKAKRLD